MRGRGSAGRLAMRRGGRFRGGAAGRGSPMSRGAGRGGITRGQGVFNFCIFFKLFFLFETRGSF